VRRSWQLAQGFCHEATDPESFYGLLARDAVEDVARYRDLVGARVIDVGGGSGFVAEAFTQAGALATTVEYSFDETTKGSHSLSRGIIADGCALPVPDGSVEVSYSSNVLEHVSTPSRLIEEMIRVLRPGGVLHLSFTNWFSPWGGHETSPWHYLGGEWAARRYRRHYGCEPKNRFGRSLFVLHISEVLRWFACHPLVDVVDAFPRYYPDWVKYVLSVPVLREVAAWNVTVVAQRR
jgi:SAM-dependent methyltransferase